MVYTRIRIFVIKRKDIHRPLERPCQSLQLIPLPPPLPLSSRLLREPLLFIKLRTLHTLIPHPLLRVCGSLPLLQHRTIPSNYRLTRILLGLLVLLSELRMLRLLSLLVLLRHLADGLGEGLGWTRILVLVLVLCVSTSAASDTYVFRIVFVDWTSGYCTGCARLDYEARRGL